MISRRGSITLASIFMTMAGASTASAQEDGRRWVASWATSIQSAYVAPSLPQGASVPAFNPQPDLSFALPDATAEGATDQTFRLIIKPDLWGDTFRIRLSNVFGTRPVTFGAATIGLQEYQANLVRGTNTRVTFNGSPAVQVPVGGEVFSDPVNLGFVERFGRRTLEGRNLAVSIAVRGASGPASHHGSAFTTSYISPPSSGDMTLHENDTGFPFSTTSFFFLSELDVLAPRNTVGVVAYGDSITDGTFSTLNGNDRWLNVMSRILHDRLGNRVSVVNAGIGGNAVSGALTGQSAVDRFSRDVIGLSGVDLVIWLEGINDLGGLRTTAEPVIAGYREVVQRLRARGIGVVGATITSSYVPSGQVPANSPLAAAAAGLGASYGSAQTNAYRQEINTFILTSGLFDATADFAAVTTDPATGTLYAPFVPNSQGSAGDYLHPNRAGYQAMGSVAAQAVLSLIRR